MRRWVVGQWLKQRNLSLKITGHPFQLSEEETTRRLGAFWRNCVRRLCFFGEDVGVDGFGQSPFYRRMNSQKCVQPKGAGAPALTERKRARRTDSPSASSPLRALRAAIQRFCFEGNQVAGRRTSRRPC